MINWGPTSLPMAIGISTLLVYVAAKMGPEYLFGPLMLVLLDQDAAGVG